MIKSCSDSLPELPRTAGAHLQLLNLPGSHASSFSLNCCHEALALHALAVHGCHPHVQACHFRRRLSLKQLMLWDPWCHTAASQHAGSHVGQWQIAACECGLCFYCDIGIAVGQCWRSCRIQYMSVLAYVLSVLAYVLPVLAYALSVLAETVICSACTCTTAVAGDTGQSACRSTACRFAISAEMLLSNPGKLHIQCQSGPQPKLLPSCN